MPSQRLYGFLGYRRGLLVGKAVHEEDSMSEASKLRGDAMLAVRETGVSVKEIAAHLDISVQRAYQLLTEAKGRSRAATAS